MYVGMMILSPRAVERFNTFKPPRAIPKIFRLAPKGKGVGVLGVQKQRFGKRVHSLQRKDNGR